MPRILLLASVLLFYSCGSQRIKLINTNKRSNSVACEAKTKDVFTADRSSNELPLEVATTQSISVVDQGPTLLNVDQSEQTFGQDSDAQLFIRSEIGTNNMTNSEVSKNEIPGRTTSEERPKFMDRAPDKMFMTSIYTYAALVVLYLLPLLFSESTVVVWILVVSTFTCLALGVATMLFGLIRLKRMRDRGEEINRSTQLKKWLSIGLSVLFVGLFAMIFLG